MSRKISIILSTLPIVLLTIIAFRFSLDLPYWDQWEFVPLLQKSYQGNLTFNDFWTPHNEHRPVFPRLIMLGLARLTNWNIRWELVINILLAIGIYFVLTKSLFLNAGDVRNKSRRGETMLFEHAHGLESRFYRDEFGKCAKKSWSTSAAATVCMPALIIFSLTQWENWVWGWQIQIFLNVFTVCLGFYYLTKSYNNKINFIISIICGIVATFSFANGLLFWPLGFLLLRLRTRFGIRSQARLRWETIVWLVVSILIYAIYLPGLPNQFDLLSIISNLLLYLSYVTAYLGAPVFGLQPAVASIFGIAGLLIFAYAYKQNKHNRGIFFISLALYAILSALFTGIGRYSLGGIQAISSRYITFGNLLWLTNIVFLYQISYFMNFTNFKNFLLKLSIFLIIFLITVTSIYRITTIRKRYFNLRPAQQALFIGTNDKLLEKLYYNGEVVKEKSEFLRSNNLSLFRK